MSCVKIACNFQESELRHDRKQNQREYVFWLQKMHLSVETIKLVNHFETIFTV